MSWIIQLVQKRRQLRFLCQRTGLPLCHFLKQLNINLPYIHERSIKTQTQEFHQDKRWVLLARAWET